MTSVTPTPMTTRGSLGDICAAVVKSHIRLIDIGKDEIGNQENKSPYSIENEEHLRGPIQREAKSDLNDAQKRYQSSEPLVELSMLSRMP